MKKILEITKALNIPEEYVIQYGRDKAKIDLEYYKEIEDRPTGAYVLVTSAMNANAAGEGKTPRLSDNYK